MAAHVRHHLVHIVARFIFIILIFITPSPFKNPVTYEQTPTPSAPASPSVEKSSTGTEATSGTAPKPAPTPEPRFWTQETMTGDWGGTRSRWQKGVELKFKSNNFYQGIAKNNDRNHITLSPSRNPALTSSPAKSEAERSGCRGDRNG